MTRLTAVLAVAMLSGCGPAWQGKVSGYSFEQKEMLYAIVDDAKGANVAALIVLSDQTNTCPMLAVKDAPKRATVVSFEIERSVDGRILSPDSAEYVVINSGIQNGNTVRGLFLKTDANGNSEIPTNGRQAVSGKLKVSQLSPEQGSLTATFDGKFGDQQDAVTTSFTATRCSIGTAQLQAGFLGEAGGVRRPPPYAGSCMSSYVCIDYTGSQYTRANTMSSCAGSSDYVFQATRCTPTAYGRCTINRGLSNEYSFVFLQNLSTNVTTCSDAGGTFDQ